jgi:Predicted nucleic acid-binding protein, contains PIN domain
MSGIDVVADTNILVELAEGKKELDRFLHNNRIFVSVVTEMELLSWSKLTESQHQFFKVLLRDCEVVELIPEIKKIAIEVRKINKVKLPDAIIAATSICLDAPLITYDSGFSKIKNLNLFLLPY